jgi:hypothetical protein
VIELKAKAAPASAPAAKTIEQWGEEIENATDAQAAQSVLDAARAAVADAADFALLQQTFDMAWSA